MCKGLLQYVSRLGLIACMAGFGSNTLAKAPVYTSYSLLPYIGLMDNNAASNKADQTIAGLYGYIGFNQNSLELAVDHLDTIKTSLFPTSFTQNDTTAVYTRYFNNEYWQPFMTLGGGMHHTDNGDTGDTSSYFINANINHLNIWGYKTWGIESHYAFSDYQRTNNTNKVNQLSLGLHKFIATDSSGSFIDIYLQTTAVVLDNAIEHSTRNYHQEKIGLDYYTGHWHLASYADIGEAPFTVEKQGFVLHNDNSINKNGFGISASYQITPHFFTRVDIDGYEMRNVSDGSTGRARKYLLFAGYSF